MKIEKVNLNKENLIIIKEIDNNVKVLEYIK